MGKKRIIKKGGNDSSASSRALARIPKKKVAVGTLNILATFNNTILTLCDNKGNTLIAASSGALGFKGSRKSTPFAAAKVGEIIGLATGATYKEINKTVWRSFPKKYNYEQRRCNLI